MKLSNAFKQSVQTMAEAFGHCQAKVSTFADATTLTACTDGQTKDFFKISFHLFPPTTSDVIVTIVNLLLV
jgi:hypothetical protein